MQQPPTERDSSHGNSGSRRRIGQGTVNLLVGAAVAASCLCLTAVLVLEGCEPSGAGHDAARTDARPAQQPADSGVRAEPVADAAPRRAPSDLLTPAKQPQRPPAATEPTFLGQPDRVILEAITTSRLEGARGTAGVSLSMRLYLRGDIDAAFKPATRIGQQWSGEVAAYRMGRLLGIGRIPPAATRKVRVPVIRSLLAGDADLLARLNRDGVFESDNTIRGAVMYWVPAINPSEIDQLYELDRWTAMLKQGGTIPPEKLTLAQQLSEMIVFDYVTGNWDRWSGGNVYFGSEKRTLLMMDNNAAFNANMSAKLRERHDAPLQQVERFGAMLHAKLAALTSESIRAELAQDLSGDQLLSDDQLAALLQRRDEVLARVETLTQSHGREAVVCFP